LLHSLYFWSVYTQAITQAQDKLAESNTIIEETLQGIANVKAFVNESYEANRYDKILRQVVNIAVRGAKFRGTYSHRLLYLFILAHL
jgi:ABC-type multidrug transport system fused ATPase/permease subunit